MTTDIELTAIDLKRQVLELEEMLVDLVDGNDASDLMDATDLPLDRCQEIEARAQQIIARDRAERRARASR